jgi:hypothetical protein
VFGDSLEPNAHSIQARESPKEEIASMSPTTTNQSTAAKKAAATRRANARRRSAAAKRAAATRELNARTPIQQAQEYAERAVLVPVGAALVARDNLVESVSDVARPYRSRETAQRQFERDVKRFERRGTTARNRVEREVKKARTRVERELRQRRTRVQRTVKQNRTRVERELKRNRTQVERQVKTLRRDLEKRAGLVGARVDEAVASGQKAVADVQERVAKVA